MLKEIIDDYIEADYDYGKLHERYYQELKANKDTYDVKDSPGHAAQQKLTALHYARLNGDLPVKPCE